MQQEEEDRQQECAKDATLHTAAIEVFNRLPRGPGLIDMIKQALRNGHYRATLLTVDDCIWYEGQQQIDYPEAMKFVRDFIERQLHCDPTYGLRCEVRQVHDTDRIHDNYTYRSSIVCDWFKLVRVDGTEDYGISTPLVTPMDTETFQDLIGFTQGRIGR